MMAKLTYEELFFNSIKFGCLQKVWICTGQSPGKPGFYCLWLITLLFWFSWNVQAHRIFALADLLTPFTDRLIIFHRSLRLEFLTKKAVYQENFTDLFMKKIFTASILVAVVFFFGIRPVFAQASALFFLWKLLLRLIMRLLIFLELTALRYVLLRLMQRQVTQAKIWARL